MRKRKRSPSDEYINWLSTLTPDEQWREAHEIQEALERLGISMTVANKAG